MTKAHTSDCDLANINPFRYRGYVYDSGTGFIISRAVTMIRLQADF